MANELSTEIRKPRTPLYKRRKFWGVVSLAVILTVGAAVYILTRTDLIQDSAGVKSGKVSVETTPEDATIIVDGKEQSKHSNTTIRLAEGHHKVKLQLATYDEQEVELDLREGQTYELQHIFTRNGLTVQEDSGKTNTYTNKNFGYEVTYPAGWSVDTDQSGNAHFYNANATKKRANTPGAEVEEAMAVLAQNNPQNLTAEQFYKAREEYPAEDQSQITQKVVQIAGQPAYQYDTPYGFVPFTNTILVGKGHAFTFQIRQGSPDRQLYDQVVASFKLN